ncbi:MAG: DUF4255 domain-containing protein [Thermoanaerobaculia bacterium]
MSNHLAIAAVTESLRAVLHDEVKTIITGAEATALRPEEAGGTTNPTRVNVFLYSVSPNAAWRGNDLPTRNSAAAVVQRPRAAVDLHYLLTFHGSETTFDPQRLMGIVVRFLHANPILKRSDVRAAVGAIAALAASDLADDIEVVRITPTPLSLEELSKLWSVFLQTKYALSMTCQASVVLIDGRETPHTSLPVATRNVVVTPLPQPRIERVGSRIRGTTEPLTFDRPVPLDHELHILGQGLRGAPTRVRVGRSIIDVPSASAEPARLIVDLRTLLPAAEQRAEVKIVQVVHDVSFGANDPHRGFESNALPFMLAPVILTSAATTTGVTVDLEPPPVAGQRVTLLLNGLQSFTFFTIAAGGNPLTIPIADVPAGLYTIRVQVDGSESPLQIENDPLDPNFGRYTGEPKVSVP